ncbi:MAG TPA: ParB/RepB/Spo0J family partition protein [Chloroflexota bacterium]|nr:ParB/RepB/Spo0J family partition protein [Chloroflexota bacterium]
MASKGGLGRGLGSLIPSGTRNGPGIAEVPVEAIRRNPRQPRQNVDPDLMADLIGSIREHGVLQPIVVTRDDDEYILIAGERRWTAARQAGLTRIPAVIKDATPRQMLELALVENVQRSDLNPLEEAAAYQQLIEEFSLTQEEVARRVGRSRSAIANSVRLLGLPEAMQHALAGGEISEGHARALLGLNDPAEVLTAFAEVIARGLNVRQTEELVRQRRQGPGEPAPAGEGEPAREVARDPAARQIEDLFREVLGTRVDLVRRGKGGRLVIHFYDEEQLQGLYDLLQRNGTTPS